MTDKPIDAEVVPESQALVVRPAQTQAVSLFGTSEPVQVIEKASQVASALKDVIKKQGLISNISGKEYPKCEAWTLLGTMIGVFPVLVWTKHLENGWEARVEARTRDGSIVGAAEAQCLVTEKNWRNRDDFALRSMAQTRATAKALRMPLGFVMTLAGYEATPAEEMVTDHPRSVQEPHKGDFTHDTKKTPPTPKPDPRRAVCATPKTREWMIRELNALEGSDDRRTVTEFFDKAGVITQTQAIEDVPLSWVPVNKVELLRLKSAIMDFASGGQAHIPYEQHAVEPSPKADSPSGTSSALTTGQKPTSGENGDPNAPDAPWRSFPMPFGKNAGVKLADLEKNYLFGLWANFEPQEQWEDAEGNVHDTKPEKLARDRQFRDMLSEAGKHYQFEKKD